MFLTKTYVLPTKASKTPKNLKHLLKNIKHQFNKVIEHEEIKGQKVTKYQLKVFWNAHNKHKKVHTSPIIQRDLVSVGSWVSRNP